MARIFCGRGTGANRCTSDSAKCGSASRETRSSSDAHRVQLRISAFMSRGASGSARDTSRMRSASTIPTRSPSPVSNVASFIAGSPDVHALLRIEIELLAGLHSERGVPRVDVVHDAVHAELARAVRIADDLPLHEIVAHLAAPRLRPAEKHALVAGQSVDHRRGLAV